MGDRSWSALVWAVFLSFAGTAAALVAMGFDVAGVAQGTPGDYFWGAFLTLVCGVVAVIFMEKM